MSDSSRQLSHRRIWALALPIMIANVTQPLLGAVDTAVVGHLADPAYLGAVSVGAIIISFLYWGFGSMKMSTTGMTAQALGAGDGLEIRATLARAVLLGLGIGVALIILQVPIGRAAFTITKASAEVEDLGQVYFSVRIWAAPAALINYAVMGWFIGMQRTRAALAVQLVLNGLNIVLDLTFVVGLHMGVAGVALASAMAEYTALAVSVFIIAGILKGVSGSLTLEAVKNRAGFGKLLALNANIFIRSVCLILAFALFTLEGAKRGDTVLAANTVVQNLFQFTAFALDGFAHGAEAIVGSAIGARNRALLRRAVLLNGIWALAFAAGIAAVYAVFGGMLIRVLTNIPEVLRIADGLLIWAVLMPLIAIWCFLLDGIFVGAMRGTDMRNMMVVSLACYLAALYSLPHWFANHGLWLALLVFFLARGVTLALRYPALEREVAPAPA